MVQCNKCKHGEKIKGTLYYLCEIQRAEMTIKVALDNDKECEWYVASK